MKIDAEIEKRRREEWRGLGQTGELTRLMTEKELPDIYLTTHEELTSSVGSPLEPSERKRKQINPYLNVGMSDNTYIRLVEQGKDPNEYARLKQERKLKRLEEGTGDDSNDEDRPLKKRRAENGSTPDSPSSAFPPKKDQKSSLLEVLEAIESSLDIELLLFFLLYRLYLLAQPFFYYLSFL